MLNRFLVYVERKAAKLQGKGWGAKTVKQEFLQATNLLESREVQLCIDIGGNKGTYTQEIIKEFPSCKVIVFEPAKVNIDVLSEKFSKNTNVQIEPYAVSHTSGKAYLFSNEEGSGLASLTKRRLDHLGIDFETTEQVNTLKFEDYWKTKLDRQHIEICKIDIEGHELDALNGFGEALKHTDVIQFEFGGCNIDTRTFFQDFWYFFKDNGFEVFRITPFGVVSVARYRELDEFFSTTNYLAKRRR